MVIGIRNALHFTEVNGKYSILADKFDTRYSLMALEGKGYVYIQNFNYILIKTTNIIFTYTLINTM
jgi:hypothetical protein